ncbi:MAG: hypothetical protein HQL35_09230 [Alphaproteobacteria bacterium]|nr:hypothetical protein [Alphaproteobacteria bacterium]
MLIYHPAYDAHQAIFRMLALLEHHPEKRMALDQLRILDFYLLFPHLLADKSLSTKARSWKKRLAQMGSSYNRVPAPQMLLEQIHPLQRSALLHLAEEGLIDGEQLEAMIVARTDKEIPVAIRKAMVDQGDDERELVEFLATIVAAIPLTGPQGLKSRTSLLEHRYDPV